MYQILRILLRFETEYAGNPQYISGNALRHALSLQLNTSIGIFTNLSKLNYPQSYQDFFSIRTNKCFLRPYFEIWYDKFSRKRAYRYFFIPNFVTFDLLNPPRNIIEHIQNKELIQLGGKRNCGFGVVKLQDYIEIELDKLQLPKESSHLTLISPSIYFPPFVEFYDCRYKTEKFWNHNKTNPIKVIAPGQFFRIKPDKNIQTIAKKGILRKVLFGQFGFGEFIVNNWTNN